MEADGTFLREYDLTGDDQEGVALVPDCEFGDAMVFIAEDAQEVWRYEGYPIACSSPGVTPTATPTPTPTATPTPTPEPGVLLQLVTGGVGLAFLNKRRTCKNRRAKPTS